MLASNSTHLGIIYLQHGSALVDAYLLLLFTQTAAK